MFFGAKHNLAADDGHQAAYPENVGFRDGEQVIGKNRKVSPLAHGDRASNMFFKGCVSWPEGQHLQCF